MKILFMCIMILLFSLTFVDAVSLKTYYNPWTGKQDYYNDDQNLTNISNIEASPFTFGGAMLVNVTGKAVYIGAALTPSETLVVGSNDDSDFDLRTASKGNSSSIHVQRAHGNLTHMTAPNQSTQASAGSVEIEVWDGDSFVDTVQFTTTIEGVVTTSTMPVYTRFTSVINSTQISSDRLRFDGLGRIGINHNKPNASAHINGSTNIDGDLNIFASNSTFSSVSNFTLNLTSDRAVRLWLIADRDDSDENDVAAIRLSQDAGAVNSLIGHESTAGDTVSGTIANSLLFGYFTSVTNAIHFFTSNGIAMTILDNRNVGIGTTNPINNLDVNGGANISRGLNITNGSLRIRNSGGGEVSINSVAVTGGATDFRMANGYILQASQSATWQGQTGNSGFRITNGTSTYSGFAGKMNDLRIFLPQNTDRICFMTNNCTAMGDGPGVDFNSTVEINGPLNVSGGNVVVSSGYKVCLNGNATCTSGFLMFNASDNTIVIQS